MNVIVHSAPAPGVAVAGDLYVDLQSRQMWLGVDPSVDPVGSVLVSDILAMQQMVDDGVALANDYTDTQILTRAPVVHHHVAADITDFDDAVIDAIGTVPGAKGFTRGMILMYSGSLADIGVGDLAGWALCDGSQSTPDLRDRFLIGAGNKPNNSKNDSTGLVTGAAGAHKHVNTGTVLTIAQLPSHNHSATLSGSGSGGTDAQGNHQHWIPNAAHGGGTEPWNGGAGADWNINSGDWTGVAGNHSHNVSVNVSVSGNTAAVGGAQAHTHDMANAPDHTHSTTLTQLRESIPYYALAFIMKL